MLQTPKVVLIGVNINNQKFFNESMTELKNLAVACQFEIVGIVEQNLKTPNLSYYIGSGKTEEVQRLMDYTAAEILIFNNELSPSQLRNLEKLFDCEILDRTALILEIFAKRAKTKEAKLQVEMAHLQYLLPRIIGAGQALSRQGGGTGGAGNRSRGEGEQKRELDRRRIIDKKNKIRQELELISRYRATQRKKRSSSGLPLVALVGYTNAGKSSLMNALIEEYSGAIDKKVLEKDLLFATLDTAVREINLPDNKRFLLADTVGFVSDLPHDLVKAFRSTLEEVREADLLLHVIDISNSNYLHQIKITDSTLKQIGADKIPVIKVYNKADLTDFSPPYLGVENDIYISAKKKIGLNELSQLICNEIFKKYIDCKMLIPYDCGKVIGYINKHAHVKMMKYQHEGVALHLSCSEADFRRYQQYIYQPAPPGQEHS